ncbi:MAG: YafY family protein [Pseudomonadota bacterium]
MHRSTRLFEIIQILRASAKPLRAEDLGEQLEVSTRTIYRDIGALQGMGTPIEGEAGIGYIMRRGYDLPPLNFDQEEIEALHVGLSMLTRSGDSSLQRAAQRICDKIEDLRGSADWLQVAPWGPLIDDPALGCVSKADLRAAIRSEQKLRITYRNEDDVETTRIVRPIALVYHIEAVMLAAWCEMRSGFRHFRTDRIWACDMLDDHFHGQSAVLREMWQDKERWNENRHSMVG